MNDKPVNTPPGYGNWMEWARSILERFLPDCPDPDLDNRRQVYAHVADFLGERLGYPAHAGRGAAHRLCGEQDETLLAEGEPCSDGRLEEATGLLQAIKVQYLLVNSRQARRVTSIVFLDGNQSAQRRVTDNLHWDLLPEDVRREHLLHGIRELTFRLYP